MTSDRVAPDAPVDEHGEYTYEPPAPSEAPQVSSLIAIIRIIAVLGMGLSVAFGLFLALAGGMLIVIGLLITLLAIPCYFGMQLAEKLAGAREGADG